eukprot:Plantae.Rhodophyta-Hildenbrandia_rubra.ctg3579.p1 GENE.Plantae.Rhodophyta-Hildenbrandia_rubra.ctg3579~~Plantae.Rhodophyta-Hildenbrandia_rubra.ctg3579.p1  ORF type:complete len:280 (-),score=25.20 Plantae.Rhodophyta-Hildenbrandia_rubra.ctg3579:1652-2491(-)
MVNVLLQPSVQAWLLGIGVFHVLGLLFEFLSTFKFAQQWRTISPKGLPAYREMLPLVLQNQVFILLPCMVALEKFGLAFHVTEKQEPASVLKELAGSVLMTFFHDVVFYLGHRFLLHSKWGYYALGHNVHHGTKAHSAISSMYMAFPDFVIEIVLPYLVPLVIVSTFCHWYLTMLALPIGCLGGMLEHSGYNFWPNIKAFDTTAHGLHHRKLKCSYSDGVGSPNIMDGMFGTSCVSSVVSSPMKALIGKLIVQREDKNTPTKQYAIVSAQGGTSRVATH